MGATIQLDKSGIWIMHVSGALRKDELDAVQADLLKELKPDAAAKVLIMVADDFCGWVGGEVWNDMTFFVKHGDRIEKMAIVGHKGWQDRMLMFAGAGFRRAPVRYFESDHVSDAYAWLD